MQFIEAIRLEWAVDLAPPDMVVHVRLIDDELVVRRAAGELAGAHDQRAKVAHHAFVALQRFFVKRRRVKVVIHAF